jgi:glycosyltransferase involved in cell wall biosynthesis
MKILFDVTSLSSYFEKSGHRAGIFYVTLNLLREFVKQNADVTLYCDFSKIYYIKNIPELGSIPILQDKSLMNRLLGYLMYQTQNCPSEIQYLCNRIMRAYKKYFGNFNSTNIAEIEKFDIYFSPFEPPSIEIEKANIKKLRMLHDVIPIVEKGVKATNFQWWQWHNRVYNTINSKDYYLANSEYTRMDVLKYFPFIPENHIKTTLLGANEEFFPDRSETPIDKKYIFSLCTLGKRKNILFAIRNFFEFINRHNIDDLYLVLGGGVWKRFEKELNETLNQFDRSKVILTGYIDEAELRKYYSNALCFIYPSLYEGFGLPVLEAMKCGCPVISSNATSLPEVIGDCGIMVNPKSDEEMISAYEKMYYEPEFRSHCILNGLERANKFTWEKCATEILDYIKSIVE